MKKPLTSTGITVLLLSLLFSLPVSSQILQTQYPVTNGVVSAIAQRGGKIYIGGSFTMVGPLIPYGICVNATSGVPDLAYLKPDGVINVAVPDGSGGWYIGGNFTMIGSTTKSRIARINADG